VLFNFLEYWTMDKVQKLSNSDYPLFFGDRDELYLLGPTKLSFYLRTEIESSLRGFVLNKEL
jgi:hypothetical protein